MLVTESGKTMLWRELHLKKALAPMAVNEAGNVMLWRDLHREKALSPMDVTEWGKLILSRVWQLAKALSPILVTELGKRITFERFKHEINLPGLSMRRLSINLYCDLIDTCKLRSQHFSKGFTPMLVNESGSVMLWSDYQKTKDSSPMSVRE